MPCLCESAGCVSDKVAQVGNLQQPFFSFFLRLMEGCCQDRDGSGDHWVPEVSRLSH